MKKTLQMLFSMAMVMWISFNLDTGSLQAQNKPDASSVRPTLGSMLPTVSHAANDKINYVRTYDVYQPLTAFPSDMSLTNAVNAGNIMQTTQYFDGLGRPVQTVARQASGNGKDLISFVVYDQYGRQVFQPMPYVKTTATDGRMQEDPSIDQGAFLNNHYTEEDIFYGKTEFENSPLNRPLKQMAPGNSWAGIDNGVSSAYLTNLIEEGVRIWILGATPATNAAYLTGKLSVIATTDENDTQVREYANSKGQVILKKVQKETAAGNGHGDWLNTYYLYDVYGNLAFVIPPRAVELLETNGWNWNNAGIDNLVFTYTYDGRNRMITKKVPGSGQVNLVYDKLDRLVLTQDANQSALNEWTFTKYDQLNRPVLTGFLTSSSNRAALQADLNSWTGELFVKREGLSTANVLEGASITTSVRDTDIATYRTKETGYIDYLPGFESITNDDFVTETVPSLSHEYTFYEGYHDATFPLLSTSVFEMNTVNYYDDYDFTAKTWNTDFSGKGFYTTTQQQADYNFVTPSQASNLKGMATGSKVRILGTNDWLTTVMFYDDRGRVVQTQGDNHLGGTDISTTQYDFAGRVLHTYTEHNNPLATTNSSTGILKEFGYDHAGRLLSIKEKLNNTGNLKTLVTNSYNELGELESKSLGDAITPLEILNYDYNIQGWLKSINGDELDDPSENGSTMTNHYFAMDLSYDYGFEQNQLNGNIAGIKWKSKSSDKIRAYGFDYDKVNRLTKANYTQGSSWSQTTADFSTSYGYDANGNILSLQRQGVVAGTITPIDNLTYDYGDGFGLAAASNRLQSVQDTEGDLGQGDFKDGNTSGDDYDYDANGNMKDDLNKGITNITYNHLNLPLVVSFGSTKSITYTYDAAGIKLSKVVDDNGSLTTTDYAGGFIYENNALQHFAHEEGRVRKNTAGSLVHDYFIKDHLGNTRMTLTEATEVVEYRASMETGTSQGVDMQNYEESLFLNLSAVRSSLEPLGNTTNVPDITDDKSARLNGSNSSTRIGPAKMMVVSAGDQINVSVDSYHAGSYSNTGYHNQTTVKAALSTVLGTGAANATEATGISSIVNGLPTSTAVFVGGDGNQTRPKAYLNVLIFDQDFEYVDGGFLQTDQASGYKPLSFTRTLNQGGYVYVYLSNESQTDFNVYFDDLRVTHTKGTILQEDHYYPFGMSINALSSSAPLSKPNKFKYNGKELNTEFDLNWYDYGARMYDPTIGKWNAVDPMSEIYQSQSSYHYALNNPVRFLDPNGMYSTEEWKKDHGLTDDDFTSLNVADSGPRQDNKKKKKGQKPDPVSLKTEIRGQTKSQTDPNAKPKPIDLSGSPDEIFEQALNFLNWLSIGNGYVRQPESSGTQVYKSGERYYNIADFVINVPEKNINGKNMIDEVNSSFLSHSSGLRFTWSFTPANFKSDQSRGLMSRITYNPRLKDDIYIKVKGPHRHAVMTLHIQGDQKIFLPIVNELMRFEPNNPNYLREK